jgi:hypothetical protein
MFINFTQHLERESTGDFFRLLMIYFLAPQKLHVFNESARNLGYLWQAEPISEHLLHDPKWRLHDPKRRLHDPKCSIHSQIRNTLLARPAPPGRENPTVRMWQPGGCSARPPGAAQPGSGNSPPGKKRGGPGWHKERKLPLKSSGSLRF